MNLPEAITLQLVVPTTWEKIQVWVCAKCGSYLCRMHGKLVFSCHCYDDRLKSSSSNESQTNSNPVLT